MADIEGCSFAAEYVPTRVERFWRWCNFGNVVFKDLPDEARKMPGWAITNICMRFSFSDRLRILISGRVRITLEQAIDVPVTTVISVERVFIERPGAPND